MAAAAEDAEAEAEAAEEELLEEELERGQVSASGMQGGEGERATSATAADPIKPN